MVREKFIRVSEEFHAYIVSKGKFGESMEDVLVRLLNLNTGKLKSGIVSKGKRMED